MKVYIAGPMRGIAMLNFPAFDEAEKILHGLGHDVVNPAALDRACGFDPARPVPITPWLKREFMRRDLFEILSGVEAIAVLDGWRNSTGATVEVALGRYLGLPILDAMTGARLNGVELCPH